MCSISKMLKDLDITRNDNDVRKLVSKKDKIKFVLNKHRLMNNKYVTNEIKNFVVTINKNILSEFNSDIQNVVDK